jgi:hypothetical protein
MSTSGRRVVTERCARYAWAAAWVRCSGKLMLLLATLVLSGCQELEEDRKRQITGCDSAFGLVPDCRFRGPQDMAVVPGHELIVVSQPAHGQSAAELWLYDPQRAFARAVPQPDSIKPLYAAVLTSPEEGWGDPECAAPGAVFSPGGVDIVRRADDRIALIVVNEGGRRVVEFFELVAPEPEEDAASAAVPVVDAAEAPLDPFQLVWRGCVRAPAAASLGDLAADADGGFWATQAFPRHRPFWSYLMARFGFSTGYLYRWRPGAGFVLLESTETRMPRGVALTPDRQHVFFSTVLGDEVRKVDVDTGEVVGRAPVTQPNRLSWGRDGRLLVVSHTAGMIARGQCDEEPAGACGFSFEILSIDPVSMDQALILAHEGAPIGAVEAVVNVGDSLYLASPFGDRVVRFPLEPRTRRRR